MDKLKTAVDQNKRVFTNLINYYYTTMSIPLNCKIQNSRVYNSMFRHICDKNGPLVYINPSYNSVKAIYTYPTTNIDKVILDESRPYNTLFVVKHGDVSEELALTPILPNESVVYRFNESYSTEENVTILLQYLQICNIKITLETFKKILSKLNLLNTYIVSLNIVLETTIDASLLPNSKYNTLYGISTVEGLYG